MKKITSAVLAVAAVLGLSAALVRAVGLVNPIVNEAGLSYNKRVVIDLQAADINTISATGVFSSATYSAASFTTGQVSSGSFKVVDNTKLSSAAATTSVTVLSTTGANGDAIVVPFITKPGAHVLVAGRDWRYLDTSTGTAQSLLLAMQTIPWLSSNRSGTIIYSTAPVGTFYNAITVQTNAATKLSISSPTMAGGRDALTVTINGVPLLAGRDFAVGASAAATATAIKNAINAKTKLSKFIVADVATSSVTLQSNLAGALYNFTTKTSNSAAVSSLYPAMIGGLTPGFALNSKVVSAPAHGFTLALPVLLSAVDTTKIPTGLTNQTTYYVAPVDADDLKLALYSTSAVAGTPAADFVTFTSSFTQTSTNTYTLTPPAFSSAAATGAKWQTSDDNSVWTDVSIASFSWTTNPGAGTVSWNLGTITHRYLGFNMVPPTYGGLKAQVTASGSFSP